MQNWKVSVPPGSMVGASIASSASTAVQSASLYWRASVPWKTAFDETQVQGAR